MFRFVNFLHTCQRCECFISIVKPMNMISSRRLVFADLQQKHREPQKNENAFYKVSLISFRSSLLILFCKFKSPNWPFKSTKQSKPIGSEKKQVHIAWKKCCHSFLFLQMFFKNLQILVSLLYFQTIQQIKGTWK